MRVFLTGGTGLIGRCLAQRLLERGDVPVILSRGGEKVWRDHALFKAEVVKGDPTAEGDWSRAVDGCDAVVNLVGHNLFANRWNSAIKRTIRDSRVHGTQHVVAAIARAGRKPKTLVQASAIGFYGPHEDEELTEESPSGGDFMARVCREWEEAAHPVQDHGVRLATIRTGVVLAKQGGALKVMTPIFKIGPGVPVGNGGGSLKPASGRQWMSWIHLDDIVGHFLHALDNPEARGPINGTAPHPVRNAEFARTLSNVLWKPYAPWRFFAPIGPPDFVLKLILGEVADVVTKGQKVLPKKAQQLGFAFRFPDLKAALTDIFARPAAVPMPKPMTAAPAAHH